MKQDWELFEEIVGKRCDELTSKIEDDESLLIAARALEDVANREAWKDRSVAIHAVVGRLFIAYDRRKREKEMTT